MSYLHIRCGVELPNSNLSAANVEPTLLQHMCSTKMAARSHDNSSSAANFFHDFIVSINDNWSIVKKPGNLPFKKIKKIIHRVTFSWNSPGCNGLVAYATRKLGAAWSGVDFDVVHN